MNALSMTGRVRADPDKSPHSDLYRHMSYKSYAGGSIGAILPALSIIFVTACGDGASEPQAVASVVLTPDNTTLVSLGETVQLTANARDVDGNVIGGKTFTWRSSDVLIVRVDSSGFVTAVANGTTSVTATTDGVSGLTSVAVRAAAVIVSPAGAAVSGVGAEQMFTVEAWDANGNRIQSPSVNWTSLNTNVATIDGGGSATAVASGQVTIQAAVNDMTGYALLTASVPRLPTVTAWSEVASGTTENLNGVWGTSPTDVYAVGRAGTILHYDGTGWSAMASGTSEGLHAVWGTSPSDIYAVGVIGGILHYDGTEWSQVASAGEILLGVWGSSPSDVYAVGSNGTIMHYNGIGWSGIVTVTATVGGFGLNGVWGSSRSDIFAVGDGGAILHYDGTEWSEMESGTDFSFEGVWGTSSSDVFAVGFGTAGGEGRIAHYDGSQWSDMASGLTGLRIELTGVWGASPSDVYAVEFIRGSIVHYDGTAWSVLPSRRELTAVWGTSSGDVYAVAHGGAILRGSR